MLSALPIHEKRILEAHVRGVDLNELFFNQIQTLSAEEQSKLQLLETKRKQGYPLQYLTGSQGFYGRDFVVTPDVLIPRPETEELVELCLNSLDRNQSMTGLELGVGSGCISISLCLENLNFKMTGTDCSLKALNVAKLNSSNLGAQNQIHWVEVSKVPAIADYSNMPSFDFMISNPPYLLEKDSVADDVRNYEPSIALFVEEPFTYYRFLSKLIKEKMKSNGKAFFEIADERALETAEIFRNAGLNVKVFKDLAERDRYLTVWTN